GAAYPHRLHRPPPELDQLGVADDLSLERLAPARLDHRAWDRVQAGAGQVPETVDGELWAGHRALDHRRLGHVVGEEARLRGVAGEVDRAGAGAAARLDHRGI